MNELRDHLNDLESAGYCVIPRLFPRELVDACRTAVWPVMSAYVEGHEPNRGTRRHFFAMPFEPPAFAPEFFFNESILRIARDVMDDRIVADQWGCDVPLQGSGHQGVHVDYARPLFAELPDLSLPPYTLVVSFGLVPIGRENGPIEIAPGTHRMRRADAQRAVEDGDIELHPVTLEVGDVLIRHPWALHRGSSNTTPTPRPLVTIRYVRRWYADDSREVSTIPRVVWEAMGPEQQAVMPFPLANG